jgi:hypothetical protein
LWWQSQRSGYVPLETVHILHIVAHIDYKYYKAVQNMAQIDRIGDLANNLVSSAIDSEHFPIHCQSSLEIFVTVEVVVEYLQVSVLRFSP